MGFTGLARWVNAPTNGLQTIETNIIANHNGVLKAPWKLSVKLYRSSLATIPGLQVHAERTICALAMNENVFVLIEDPSAPTKADVLAMLPPGSSPPAYMHGPSHYRSTFLTLRPPDALDQLLSQLRARWVPVRQTTTGSQRAQAAIHQGQQLTIEGHVFTIGNEWIVRVGNVILAGGAIKGMLLEAEYLPLPILRSNSADGTSEFLSNLLASLLPNLPDAKTVAVTISDSQWEEVLWVGDKEDDVQTDAKEENGEDSVFCSGDEEEAAQMGDWVGVERDKKASFVIIGALRSEGIL